ncbi:MAG: hypothetical protein GY834_14535 [Bacteroidetes bacterium]|nr:hypothetical protein [Bacteroidota bacterium]
MKKLKNTELIVTKEGVDGAFNRHGFRILWVTPHPLGRNKIGSILIVRPLAAGNFIPILKNDFNISLLKMN